MTSEGPLLIPVTPRGSHYVVSEDWLRAELEFPPLEEKLVLLARGYKTRRGIVHYEGAARQAIILTPPTDREQEYADLLPEKVEGEPPTKLPGEDTQAEYIDQVRKRFAYSEGVLPEQRMRIESEFVEPLLQTEHAGRDISWGQIRPESYLFIVGGPGSGKTTLLRQWLLWHAARTERGESELIPVCLQLRDLKQGEKLELAIRRTLADSEFGWLAASLASLAERGRIALAFDGVDEVPFEDRAAVINDLQEFTSAFPKCKYLLTSRPDIDVRLEIGLERVRIKPFDEMRLRQIAYHRMYDNHLWREFSCKVESESVLDSIVASPLAYTFLISRYVRNSVHPSFLSETVASLVDLLVDTWDSSRGVTRARTKAVSPGATYKVLSALAALKDQNFPSESLPQLYERVSHLVPDQSAFATLHSVRENTGLIRYDEKSGWAFSHRTFEEYFSALSWVSSLTSKFDIYLKELFKPVTRDSASFRRFVGYMSSDASSVIESALLSTAGNETRLATNLAYLLTQRMPVADNALAGFARLVVAALTDDILHRRIRWEYSSDTRCSPRLLLETHPDHHSDTAELIAALHSGRDGAGGTAVKTALEMQSEGVYAALASIIAREGKLVIRRHDDGLEVYVADPTSEEAIDFGQAAR